MDRAPRDARRNQHRAGKRTSDQADARRRMRSAADCKATHMSGDRTSAWQRWVRRPQTTAFRKAVFQVHLWSGIGLGLYIIMISVTGSLLVYRGELSVAATPAPIVSSGSGSRLTDAELSVAAVGRYPGYQIERIARARNLDQAVGVWLRRGEELEGAALRSAQRCRRRTLETVRARRDRRHRAAARQSFRRSCRAKSESVRRGRDRLARVDGPHVWWPGVARWRRSLVLRRGVGFKRFVWDLHGVVGFWSFAFILVFGLSGIPCARPRTAGVRRLARAADRGEHGRPVRGRSAVLARVSALRPHSRYRIPCTGPGFCDQATKAVWRCSGWRRRPRS